MIVVDSSVWIDHIRDRQTREVELLRAHIPRQDIVVGDLILLEVLRVPAMPTMPRGWTNFYRNFMPAAWWTTPS